MNSSSVQTAWAFSAGSALPLPMVQGWVRAGFPSPADDFTVKRQDLNELLVTHPHATFFWRVRGTSMEGAGMSDGDILVVNRALTPVHGDIVVAEVDGGFTVKYLHKRHGRVKLQAANPLFPDLLFEHDGAALVLVGVVTCTIKRYR